MLGLTSREVYNSISIKTREKNSERYENEETKDFSKQPSYSSKIQKLMMNILTHKIEKMKQDQLLSIN